jgi:hypothetical protein
MVKPDDNTDPSVENVMVIQLLEEVKGPRAPEPELPANNTEAPKLSQYTRPDSLKLLAKHKDYHCVGFTWKCNGDRMRSQEKQDNLARREFQNLGLPRIGGATKEDRATVTGE